MSLAPLGFTVDTAPVAKAVGDLDRLTSATAKAQAGTKGASTATNAAAASVREHGSAAALAATKVNTSTAAITANSAALVASNTQTKMAQLQTRNLAFQFQDIGTMLAMGQSPFMLLAQQLPQITMYGGQLGGVMGALKSTIGSIFSPLGLLTTGFVLAASAAISYFSDAGDEADNAADALAEQADLIQRVADKWGDAIPEVRAYADELQRALDLRELKEGIDTQIDARFTQARANISELRAEVGKLIEDMIRSPETSGQASALGAAFNEVGRAAQDLRDKQKEVGSTTEEMERLSRSLAALLGNQVVAASDDAADAMRRYADAVKDAADEGERLRIAAALAALGETELGVLGRVQPLYSDGGKFIDEAGLQDVRANATKSQYQIEQERASRKGRRGGSKKTDTQRSAESYDEMIRKSEQFIAAQQLEQQALFMTEEAAQALRYEQELLNQAANDNIKITPEMAAELSNLAQEMSATEAITAKLKESFDFTKDAAKGVLSSLRQDLLNGELSWRSFGDAAMSVLDKIINKLEDQVATAFANAFSGGSGALGGGGIGGILSSIFGGMFGGGRPAFNTNATAGAAWTGLRLASGTSFAPGGMALVGEEGPELVNLPRGSKVNTANETRRMLAPANSNSGTVVVNQTFQISGAVSSDDVVAAIKKQASVTKSEIESGFAKTYAKNQRAAQI